MNTFRADLHIHSRFSRATSSKLTVPHLAAWAGAKGIEVLATGDFTHPVWRDELRNALIPDENSGLLRLRRPLDNADTSREIPALAALPLNEPSFMLQAEISSIYKKNGAVRKVHSLVYVPDFDAAGALCRRLDRIGNLNSDGRPILGLDVHHLLDMVLEIPRAFLVPAHIWTPWFSLFGSKSGFNSLDECFDDLTPHIFALETGLSSDPDMNRCWSHLDTLTMVSSSDAHSGENLGREATLFRGEMSYDGIWNALRSPTHTEGQSTHYAGTLEFFPDEGKYHLDGHRACHVALDPAESLRLHNICPVCGKPLTVGVLHRVLELADRPAPPHPGQHFQSLIPLAEILGELLHCGPKTKKPQAKLAELAHRFGPELKLLIDSPLAEINAYWPELGEALRRMRAGQVIRQGGYDGEYGVIRLFEPNENRPSLLKSVPQARRKPLSESASTLAAGAAPLDDANDVHKTNDAKIVRPAKGTSRKASAIKNASASDLWHNTMLEWKAAEADPASPSHPATKFGHAQMAQDMGSSFSPAQRQALEYGPGPVLVLAGPGSGKTRTLTGRVLHLVQQDTPTSDIVAVTFTRRAAEELRERLNTALNSARNMPHNASITLAPGVMATASGHTVAHTGAHTADRAQSLDLSRVNASEPVTPPLASPVALPVALPVASPVAPPVAADTLHALALAHWPGPPPIILNGEAARRAFAAANPSVTPPDISALWEELELGRERLNVPPHLEPYAAAYAAWKKEQGLADYADLPETWLALLQSGAPRPWKHVLVDEVQDLSPLQRALLLALLPKEGSGFFGIGDPDQSIYSFRGAGADIAAFLSQSWPTLKLLSLDESHRAAEAVLAAGRAALGPGAACSNLHSVTGKAATLQWAVVPTAEREAAWVADRVAYLLGGTAHGQADRYEQWKDCHLEAGSCSPGDIAVLVRLKALMPPIRAALEKRGIPCAMPETEAFWDDPRVNILLQGAALFLRSQANEHNPAQQTPKPLGEPFVSLCSFCPNDVWQQGPEAVLSAMRAKAPQSFDPLFDTSPAFRQMLAAHDKQGGWQNLLDFVTLRQDLDLVGRRAEQVRLMTLHASKGLEFRVVFLPCLEQGLLPFYGTDALLHALPDPHPNSQPDNKAGQEEAFAPSASHIAQQNNNDEERRLLYVGLTRAAEALFASCAAQRRLYGHLLHLPPSSLFPASCFQGIHMKKQIKTSTSQLSLFD